MRIDYPCVKRDSVREKNYPSDVMEVVSCCTKVVTCLVLTDLMKVGAGEISFRHQVVSDDIHQDTRYHKSLCLVSLTHRQL